MGRAFVAPSDCSHSPRLPSKTGPAVIWRWILVAPVSTQRLRQRISLVRRCDGEATNACGRCLARYYCSRQCQTSHWKEEHRNECSVLALSTVQSRQLEIYGMVLKGEFSQAEVGWSVGPCRPHTHAPRSGRTPSHPTRAAPRDGRADLGLMAWHRVERTHTYAHAHAHRRTSGG